MKILRIVVCGGGGRMGGRLVELGRRRKSVRIAAIVERPDYPVRRKTSIPVFTDLAEAIARTRPDVVADFTIPSAAVSHAQVCAAARKPIAIGTTGFTPAHLRRIRSAARRTAILLSPNFSVAVNLLFELARRAAQALPSFRPRITEIHHRHKKDRPSGTARRLAEALGRPVRIRSIRQGEVTGIHRLVFSDSSERLEIGHEALSRDCFAEGCLRAMRWLARRRAGLYTMADVLRSHP